MKSVTIRDLAHRAGVSVGTVSRVLNHAENVDAQLRQKILAAIKKAGYQPVPRGRPRIQTGNRSPARYKTLAIIFPEMAESWRTNALWGSYMTGIERACRERQYSCLIHFAGEAITSRNGGGVRGVLLKTPDAVPTFLADAAKRWPVVMFGGYNPRISYPQVAFDDYAAGRMAVENLAAAGHRRIVFVNHEPQKQMFFQRSRGARDCFHGLALGKEGLVLDLDAALHSASGSTVPQGIPPDMNGVLDRLLSMKNPPTGVAFVNDWAALGFYRACATRGIPIPGTFSVVGIDDSRELCETATPPLSSVALPFDRVAYFAACLLLDLIDGRGAERRNAPSIQYIPGEFHARASVREIGPAG